MRHVPTSRAKSAACVGLFLTSLACGAGLKVQIIEPVTGFDSSLVSCINARGEIAFNSYLSTGLSSTGAVLREGTIFTVPFAGRNTLGILNASGLTSGTGFTPDGSSRGFRWMPGGNFELLQPLPPAGPNDTPSCSAGVLSDSGVAAGTSRSFPENRQHAVLYNSGSGTPIDLQPGSQNHSFVRGANASGDVLISFNNTNFGVFNGGNAITSFLPANSTGFSMNFLTESRAVAGYCLIRNFSLGFSVATATRWDLQGGFLQPAVLPPLPTRDSSMAHAANNKGVVVGRAFQSIGGSDPIAVAWINGVPIDLNAVMEPIPGVTLKYATTVNDNLDVGGVADRNGLEVGFVIHLGDSDGDGLLDSWEAAGGGIDSDGDGIIDLDLHALGATPDHKDIFVEVDSGANSRLPEPSRRRVVDAFARAPVQNPDGVSGIQLHVLLDESNLPIPLFASTFGSLPGDFDALKLAHFGTVAQHSQPAVLAAKRKAFRYCIVYNKDQSVNGVGEQPGNDFAIFLGNACFHDGFRDLDECAAVFMHELGHTLNLGHGGLNDVIGKPNYPSIMNYSLSHPMPYNAGFWKLDYSRAAFGLLNEANLEESVGVPAGGVANVSLYANFFLPFGSGPDSARVFRLARLDGSAVDWSGDGNATGSGVIQDLNFYGPGPGGFSVPHTGTPSPGQAHDGFDDWANVELKIGEFGNFADDAAARTPLPEELGSEALSFLSEAVPIPPIPPFFQRSDINEDGLVDDADFSIFVVSYNELVIPPAEDRCDINGDDFVDDADFSIFIVAYDMLVPP